MKDNFSRQAEGYKKYRPEYPPELFEFILQHVNERNTAWDVGTGNGQTAKELSPYFNKIIATDISQKQLDNATEAPNIQYSLQPAESTNIESNSIDLVTVSQALHWFDFEKFYTEVRRVSKPGACIAAWTYTLLTVSDHIDQLMREHFYTKIIGPYWDKERQHVDNNYQSIPFPFEESPAPDFSIYFNWAIEDLQGYLNTWSAVQKFIAANNYNPVDAFIYSIRDIWFDGQQDADGRRPVVFPVHMRIGTVN